MTTEKPKEPPKDEPKKRSILTERLINTRDSKETYLRALLYGVSGAGKTHTARTLPLDRTLVLLAEPKHLPLRGLDIDAINIHTWSEFKRVYSEIAVALKNGGLKINGKKKDILFIDSVSHINELCKKEIITKDRPELLGKAGKDVGNIYDEQLAMQDWGLLNTRIPNMVSAFCHLPVHVIFTCLEKRTTNEQTGETLIVPDLNGKLPTSIPHHFDAVFHQRMRDVDGQIITEFETHGNERILAKGQAEIDAVEPADWTAILQKLFGKKEK